MRVSLFLREYTLKYLEVKYIYFFAFMYNYVNFSIIFYVFN